MNECASSGEIWKLTRCYNYNYNGRSTTLVGNLKANGEDPSPLTIRLLINSTTFHRSNEFSTSREMKKLEIKL